MASGNTESRDGATRSCGFGGGVEATFGARVLDVTPLADDRWRVTYETQQGCSTDDYDAGVDTGFDAPSPGWAAGGADDADAARVALPSAERPAYVERLMDLTRPHASGLLITFDYPQDEMDGPPFALSDEEVEALFAETCTVERLAFEDLTDGDGRDLSRCNRSAFRLRRR